jgi:plasmid stability protein
MAGSTLCWQDGSMTEPSEVSLQVRHVPPDVHATLRKRAAAEGKSLQEYVLGLLVAQARKPTRHEVLARAGRRSGGHLSFEETNEILRAERESR